MQVQEFLDLGISGAMIIALLWIVRAFLAHLVKKDETFSLTINNHLSHSLEAQTKLEASHNKLSDAITRLEEKL